MKKNEEELYLYKVLPKYIDALRDEENGGDKSVYMVAEGKEDRPFIGIVTICNSRYYLIPLSSYKERFKYLTTKEPDFMPIYCKGKLVAGIEFNKMIPVPLNQIRPLDIIVRKHDSKRLIDKKELRKYEYEWCNRHKDAIIRKARSLYDLFGTKDPDYKNIKFCLDFYKLERICDEYEKKHMPQH